MYKIAVINQKGGTGKTTIACNLTSAAHLAGKRTLILDLDTQGSALDWFAAREETSALMGLAVAKVDRVLTRPALAQLTRGYDVVVLDAPPHLGDMTRSAAVAADTVVIPVQPSPHDLWASQRTLATLDSADAIRAQLEIAPVRRIFVVNRAVAGTVIAREAQAALAGVGVVADVSICQRIAFAESASCGESVLTSDPRGKAANEIRALFAAIQPVSERVAA